MQHQLTDVEVAWLAGLYEGEGTAYTQTKEYQRAGGTGVGISTTVRVAICMTDRDVLERVQSLFPSPSGIRERQRAAEHKRQYEWRIGRRDDVARFLRLVLPHLLERRAAQARDVLARAEDPNGGLGSGHRNKTHCPHGHPYDEANTGPSCGTTLRRCRACAREYQRKRRAAR